jgi:hypothetical protein
MLQARRWAIPLTLLLSVFPVASAQSQVMTLVCNGVLRLHPPSGTFGPSVSATRENIVVRIDLANLRGSFDQGYLLSIHPGTVTVMQGSYDIQVNGSIRYPGGTIVFEQLIIDRFVGDVRQLFRLSDGRTFSYFSEGRCSQANQRF